MPCVWARNSAVMPMISAPLVVRWNSLGLMSMPSSIGMWCMCSRPPTICTSSKPAMMACEAWLIACRLEPHSRLTVAPPVSSPGRPSARRCGRRSALARPAAGCCPAPRLRFRRDRCRSVRPGLATTSTARSSERTSRKTPLSLWARPIGVRTQSTITARFIGRFPRQC